MLHRIAQIENLPNSKIIYLHAKEIIQRLGDGTIDIGISGLDLLQESSINLQKKIEIKKKLDFGVADVVVAVERQRPPTELNSCFPLKVEWIANRSHVT